MFGIIVSSNKGHDMKQLGIQKKEARIKEVITKMGEIPALLEGTLMVKRNRVKRKDGSVHVSPEYYTFQYRGADGKRKWKRIPKSKKTAVKRLVEAGKQYRELEKEYTALLTEISLDEGGKKND